MSYWEHLAAWKVLLCLKKSVHACSFAEGGFSILTFDVVVHPLFFMAAAALFHSNGHLITAWTSKTEITDPLIGEATTALLAHSKAQDAALSIFVLARDSSVVLENLQARGRCLSLPWRIASLISSLVDLLGSFSCVSTISQYCL